jgi:hypothetical protein
MPQAGIDIAALDEGVGMVDGGTELLCRRGVKHHALGVVRGIGPRWVGDTHYIAPFTQNQETPEFLSASRAMNRHLSISDRRRCSSRRALLSRQ